MPSTITTAYAPPIVWGPWVSVYQRIRLDDQPHSIRISYSPVGNTAVFGEVRYNSPNGFRQQGLPSGTIIVLGAGLGSHVEMRFRTGIPLGTAVDVSVGG